MRRLIARRIDRNSLSKEEIVIRCLLAVLLALTMFQLTPAQSVTIQADGVATTTVNSPFLGVWQTHFEQTFFTLIINPDQTAYFILIEGGSHQLTKVKWEPVAGGILVDSLPRFRLWKVPKDEDSVARAQMEALDPALTGSSIRRFPTSFYMKHLRRDELVRTLPIDFAKREVPAGWSNETPPEEFDAQVGIPRTPRSR